MGEASESVLHPTTQQHADRLVPRVLHSVKLRSTDDTDSRYSTDRVNTSDRAGGSGFCWGTTSAGLWARARGGWQAMLGAALGVTLGACNPNAVDLSGPITALSQAPAAQHAATTEEVALRKARAAGAAALPYIEAGFQHAAPVGRRKLVVLMRQLAFSEACALLAHVAALDPDPGVAAEAAFTLSMWAARSGSDSLSRAARASLPKVEALRPDALDGAFSLSPRPSAGPARVP